MCGIIGKHTVDLGADAMLKITVNGLLDDGEAKQIQGKIEFFATRLENQGFPVYVLVDLSNLEDYTDDVSTDTLTWLGESKFDKLAIVGGQFVEKLVITLTAKVLDKEIEFFGNVGEAIKWLKG